MDMPHASSTVELRAAPNANSDNPGQLLQRVPVVQAILVGGEDEFSGFSVLVEVLRKAAFRAGEGDEVEHFDNAGGKRRKMQRLLDERWPQDGDRGHRPCLPAESKWKRSRRFLPKAVP